MTALIGLVAFLYSLVGHGGASGYLAVMSLAGADPSLMKPGALVLNVLVSGIAFLNYRQAGHFDLRLFWLFAASSVPAAFLGGMLQVAPRTYCLILGGALVFAAVRMWLPDVRGEAPRPPSAAAALPLGAAMGLVSGIVGIGGGIILSPLLLLSGWADAKRTAAVSAAFIWVNSVAGLAGHAGRGHAIGVPWGWVAAAGIASVAGSYLGARRLTGTTLRRCLGAILLLAALKLLAGGP